MSEYEKIALATRRKVSKLTLEQQRELLNLYESTIESLVRKATRSRDKSLTQRWLLDYQKELTKAKDDLRRSISKSTRGYITKAAKIGTETEQQIMKRIFEAAALDVGPHFNTMFSVVQNQVIADILSGNLYKDKKTLSQRIWDHSSKFERDIQYVINQGILEKKSALELARDLEHFVKEPAKRPWEWRKVYPNMGNTRIDYNAQRLARTSINHAYQNSSIQSSGMNPFVEGIEWRSAQIHGRTCDLCLDRHGQVFPKDDVPLDHPNGLCTMLPYIPKDLDAVADELKDWLDGGDNPMLDKWYEEYGEYFSTGSLSDILTAKDKKEVIKGEPNIFRPAKTKEEAEEYIQNKHNIKADYSKFHLDVANAINEDMDRIIDILGELPTLKEIGTFIKKKSVSVKGMYQPGSQRISLRNVGNKNSLGHLGKIAKDAKKTGHFSTGSELHTFRHEVGHAYSEAYRDKLIGDISRMKEIGNLRQEIVNETLITKRGTVVYGEKISIYGMTNPEELIAESIAEYLDGNPREIAQKVVDILIYGRKG